MNLTVSHPGLLTTVQDPGRRGWQQYGVAVGGAADELAARVANVLVGNDPDAALLEITQVGPELSFDQDTLVAWCGAGFPATVDGEPLPRNHTLRIEAGERITFPFTPTGWRGWLAVAGGIAVPTVLGSRSTCGRSGFGGHAGRALLAGDRLPIGEPSTWAEKVLARLNDDGTRSSSWSVMPSSLGQPAPRGNVRTMKGPEWDWFTGEAQRHWLGSDWRVAPDSDRMGMRLLGPPLTLREPREMISSAVTAGVVQVPASKQPILLLADRQTVGGYPRLAAVAGVDLGILAQLRPGERVRFTDISLAEAHALRARCESHFRLVRAGLARFAQGL